MAGMSEVDVLKIRFPYRVETPADQAGVDRRVNDLLVKTQPIIWDLAKQINKAYRLPYEDVEDIQTGCLRYLWKVSLPRYDAHREPVTSPTTFLWHCSRGYLKKEFKRTAKRNNRRSSSVAAVDLSTLQADDESVSRLVDRFAREIISNPEKYLLPQQVRVLNAKLNNPHMLTQDLAKVLGYERSSSLCMMISRIKTSIADLSIEDHERPGDGKNT